MNSKIITIFFFFALTTLTNSQMQELDVLLTDKVFVQNQIDCVMDRRICDRTGNEIKGKKKKMKI